MSLAADLAPRLSLIRRLVREQYALYLQQVQSGVEPPHRIMLNDQDAIVPEPTSLEVPSHSQHMLQDALEKWREDWENTTAAVDDLDRLVQEFYVIDHDDGVLEDIWQKLGRRPRQQQDTTRATGHRPPENSGTVYDEVAYARYYVDEQFYNVTLDIRDEARQPDRPLPDHLAHPIDVVSEHWDGVTAAVFFWQFVVPFDEAAARQLEYVRQLSANIHCLRLIRDRTKLSIQKIIDNCVRSLGGASEMEPLVPEPSIIDQLGDLSLGDANTVAGLILSGLGLVMSASAASITVGVLGVGSATLSIHQMVEARNEGSDDIDLNVVDMATYGSPHPVILSTQDAIRRLTDWMSRKDDVLGRGLEQDMAATDSLNSHKLWLHLPGDFSGDHDFRLNEATTQDVIGAQLAALRRAGQTELPETTAGSFDNAATRLSECSLPSWVATYLPRSHTNVHAARDSLGHLLKTTRNNLAVWGDELVQIADDYQWTDFDNAREVGGTMDS
jgi:hypothetical protein